MKRLIIILFFSFCISNPKKEEYSQKNDLNSLLLGNWTIDYEATLLEVFKKNSIEYEKNLDLYSVFFNKIQNEIKSLIFQFEKKQDLYLWSVVYKINEKEIKEEGIFTFDFSKQSEKNLLYLESQKENKKEILEVEFLEKDKLLITSATGNFDFTKIVLKKIVKENEN